MRGGELCNSPNPEKCNKRMVVTRYSVRVFEGQLASAREFCYSRVISRHLSGATS